MAALHLVVGITGYLLLLCLLIINGIFTTVICMITNAVVMGLIHAHLSKPEEKAVVSNPPVAGKQRWLATVAASGSLRMPYSLSVAQLIGYRFPCRTVKRTNAFPGLKWPPFFASYS